MVGGSDTRARGGERHVRSSRPRQVWAVPVDGSSSASLPRSRTARSAPYSRVTSGRAALVGADGPVTPRAPRVHGRTSVRDPILPRPEVGRQGSAFPAMGPSRRESPSQSSVAPQTGKARPSTWAGMARAATVARPPSVTHPRLAGRRTSKERNRSSSDAIAKTVPGWTSPPTPLARAAGRSCRPARRGPRADARRGHPSDPLARWLARHGAPDGVEQGKLRQQPRCGGECAGHCARLRRPGSSAAHQSCHLGRYHISVTWGAGVGPLGRGGRSASRGPKRLSDKTPADAPATSGQGASHTRGLCLRHAGWAVDATTREELPSGWHDLAERLFASSPRCSTTTSSPASRTGARARSASPWRRR